VTESTLSATEGLLREQAERLRLALAAGAVGTWDYYPKSGELIWDERCRQIHGLEANAPVSYDEFQRTIHPDDRQRVDELVQRMLDPASGGLYVVEYRIVRLSDRAERWISVRGSVLFDEAGSATRFIGTTQDITEQREWAETRERLIGIVGHDLRGPLSAIRMAANLLAREVPAHRKKHVEITLRSVDRMEAIISELLDYTRVRLGGGISLTREHVDLVALAGQIIDEVGLARGGPRPTLDQHGECGGWWDRTRLGQVLANLLYNAMTYGDPARPLVVSVRGRPADVLVEVHNEGPRSALISSRGSSSRSSEGARRTNEAVSVLACSSRARSSSRTAAPSASSRRRRPAPPFGSSCRAPRRHTAPVTDHGDRPEHRSEVVARA
jgi:PAS domain S-box-containing protein